MSDNSTSNHEMEVLKRQVLGLLYNAKYEISRLRRQVVGLEPKAEAYDVIRAGLLGRPHPIVEGEDINGRIQETIDLIEAGLEKNG